MKASLEKISERSDERFFESIPEGNSEEIPGRLFVEIHEAILRNAWNIL